MMRSEFIERTGFEPTADEYAEIEREYMGCDADKDTFCKKWKKQGGIGRMISRRARRIEELEAEVAMKDRQYNELDIRRCREFNHMKEHMQFEIDATYRAMKDLRDCYEELEKKLDDETAKRIEAETKIAKVMESFVILGIVKEVQE